MSRAPLPDGASPPVVIELVGPPGSGKSTLARELLRGDGRIVGKPVLRRRPHRRALGLAVASVLWTLLRRRAMRGKTWEHVVTMAYVEALPQALRHAGFRGSVVVFDQGPVYFLARPALRDARLAPWREQMLSRWRETIDGVVVLDADDDVLLGRIDARAKTHRLADEPAPVARELLREAREASEVVLARLAGGDGPTVLRLDTGRTPVAELTTSVAAAIAALRPERAAHLGVLARPV